MKIQTFKEFVETDITVEPHLVDPLIPRNGVTLIHGPAGAGKSALGFHLVKSLSEGQPFLGIHTEKTTALYLNLEMPEPGLHNRLKVAGFAPPEAYIITHPPVDLLQQTFKFSDEYRTIRGYVDHFKIECVVIDNAGCLVSQSINNDDTARGCIATLRDWFSDRSVVLIHHDRKHWRDPTTGELIHSSEDAAGSKYWINSVVSQIHVYRSNDELRVLRHEKSQVMAQLEEPVKFILGADGMEIILWSEKKSHDTAEKLTAAEVHLRRETPQWDQMTEDEKVTAIAKLLDTSPRTVWRWKKATAMKEKGERN